MRRSTSSFTWSMTLSMCRERFSYPVLSTIMDFWVLATRLTTLVTLHSSGTIWLCGTKTFRRFSRFKVKWLASQFRSSRARIWSRFIWWPSNIQAANGHASESTIMTWLIFRGLTRLRRQHSSPINYTKLLSSKMPSVSTLNMKM